MRWLHDNAFNAPTWLVNVSTLKNIDYSGYTELFRNVQARHLKNVLSFEPIGRLMDAEIMGADNYKALDLLRDMRKGIWKETVAGANVLIYRRNLQRAYIERMNYLMNEEIKSEKSDGYYDVSQSDLRSLVRGELNVLKATLVEAKRKSLNTETK